MRSKTCARCGDAVPKRHRTYCATCSALASKLWRAEMRRRWHGESYSLDWWLKRAGGDEALARQNRAQYMRCWRAKRHANGSIVPAS